MAQIINISIDLAKIDKAKIKEVVKKDGSTAKYLDVSLFIGDEPDNYGHHASLSINQTKEEREAKTPKIYLGNGKITWSSKAEPGKTENQMGVNDSDLPFLP